jgi:hypothetical protein
MNRNSPIIAIFGSFSCSRLVGLISFLYCDQYRVEFHFECAHVPKRDVQVRVAQLELQEI